MRISDWSSDVCSSDLCRRSRAATALIPCGVGYRQARGISGSLGGGQARVVCATSASPISYGTMFCQWNDGRSAPEQRCRAGLFLHLGHRAARSEEHTSELQSLMRISYAVFCLKKKNKHDKK